VGKLFAKLQRPRAAGKKVTAMSVTQRELFVAGASSVEASLRGRDEAQASGGDLGDGSSAEPVSSDEHDQYDIVPLGTDGGISTEIAALGKPPRTRVTPQLLLQATLRLLPLLKH